MEGEGSDAQLTYPVENPQHFLELVSPPKLEQVDNLYFPVKLRG